MLTYEAAKKVGVDACVEKLGREFVKMHKDTSCAGYGDAEDYAFCYVGVDDRPEPKWNKSEVILDDGPGGKFPYIASCNVWYADGKIEFQDCVLPETTSV